MDTPGDCSSQLDILLVDDRPENLLALEAALSSPDYRFIKANSGREALLYLMSHEPALILLDVQMPDIDGFQTAGLIKQDERLRHIPIIFITAVNTETRFVRQGYQGGAVDYLYKPFDPEILQAKVSVFADLFRKNQEIVKAQRTLLEAERKEREKRLQELELRALKRDQIQQQRYRDLIDNIVHGIVWTADPKTLSFSFVSTSAERISGYPIQSWLSEPGFFFAKAPESERRNLQAVISRIFRSGNPERIEHRFQHANGTEIWLQTTVRLARNHDGAQILHGLSLDVTREKAYEIKLKRNKERSEFLAHASLVLSETLNFSETLEKIGKLAVPALADWYSVDKFDEDGNFVTLVSTGTEGQSSSLVREMAAHMNLTTDSDLGPARVFRSGKAEIYPEVAWPALKSQGLTHEQYLVLKAHRISSAMILPLVARGKVIALLTLISQRSQQRYDSDDLEMAQELATRIAIAMDNALLYEQSVSAVRARDEFLSIASHELKTPLTPLFLQLQSLQRLMKNSNNQPISIERLEKHVAVTNRQVERLSRLVDDLLDISRIHVGRFELKYEEFDLGTLIRDVVDRFNDQLENARCTINVNVPMALTVTWDRFRMEQVLVNLISNAIKYGAGAPIEVHADADLITDRVQIAVRDHGIGIAKEDLRRIFGRFERAVSSSHFGGLGLGLYISSQIIESHGGRIHAESIVQEGSRFIVEIPRTSLALANSAHDEGATA